MKGCWIDILDSQSKETVRFKVEDDVIVFPAEAKGSQVVAEGILRKHEMSKEQAINWLRHLAEEKGESFDDSSVTGPMDFYQIEGLGAEVTAPLRRIVQGARASSPEHGQRRLAMPSGDLTAGGQRARRFRFGACASPTAQRYLLRQRNRRGATP